MTSALADLSIRRFRSIVRVSAADSAGTHSVVEHTLEPGLLALPPHTHARETETIVLLEGKLSVRVGEQVRVLRAGDVVVLPANVQHAAWNVGEDPARWLEISAPGGIEAHYGRVVPLVPRTGATDVGAIRAVAREDGIVYDVDGIYALVETYGVSLP